ncbi:MAG: MFS transporter [Actinomycetota bacterium]|nr:MAG: MFS transporter [Actinomycetota bacterium]
MSAPAPTVPDIARRPAHAGLVLATLILGAVVANINLGIANVALPTIGRELQASQTQLTAVANAFSLGLACSVLYFGAIGDRYGRKLLFLIGAAASIPTAMLAAWASDPQLLAAYRFLGGLSAGLLFPTTLSLITALWSGPARTKAIALWSGIGGGMAPLGPIVGGWLLEHFWWGSVFLLTAPFAALALVLGIFLVPGRTRTDPARVDHLGGVLSVIGVAALVLVIERVSGGLTPLWLTAFGVALVILAAFFWRQTRAPHPLVDLTLAKATTFWVAVVAGMITFGSLIGAMFIGQQFTQNVLAMEPLNASLCALPAAAAMVLGAPVAGQLLLRRGGRATFALGLLNVALGFLVMLVTWRPGASVTWVCVGYLFVGLGVGFSATPASRSLMSSLPVRRAGMGSAFLDLTRDLGGSIVQAAMGALLAVAYTGYFTQAFAALPPQQAQQLGSQAAQTIGSSYAGAAEVATGFPQAQAAQIVAAANTAFTEGKSAAIGLALLLTLVALGLVLWRYPRQQQEEAFFASVAAADAAAPPASRPASAR